MAVLEAEARISAVDATGPVFDNVAAKFDKLKGTLSSGGDAVTKFGGSGVAAMNDVGAAADRVDSTLTRIIGVLASGAILHKITALAEASALAYADLDDVRRMQAATAGTAEAPPALVEQARRLGRGATRFSEIDVSKAQLAVQQAGVAVDAVGPVIEGAKDFAVAMQATDLAQVAKHLVETRDALKQIGEESPAALQRLMDREVKLHQISGMSEEAIAAAYAQGGVTAAATGLSDASVAAMLALMARTGVTGEAAGTTLRLFLTKLAQPGKEGIEALGGMGIDYQKFTTEGTLTPEAFANFMARHGMIVTERQAGALAKIFANPEIMGSQDRFANEVINAAGATLRDKHGQIKREATKKLTEDVQKFYAEHIGKVDYEGLVEAIEAAHPTLAQLTPLFGTLRAARALPFLRDQTEYERVKALFENVPEGMPAKAAAIEEGGPGGGLRKVEAGITGLKERSGGVWGDELATATHATAAWLNSLTDKGVQAVDIAGAGIAGLAAWEGLAALARSSAMALLPFRAAAATGPWGALTLPLMLGGDTPEWAPKWGEYINPSTGLPHFSIEDIRGLGREERAAPSAVPERAPPAAFFFGSDEMAPQAAAGLSRFSIDDIRAAVGGTPVAEVKGNAELKVNVEVAPSASFISQIVSAIRNEINVFGGGGGIGTAGSTGRSMPEAGPAPQ